MNPSSDPSGSFLLDLLVTLAALAFVLALAWIFLRLLKRGMQAHGASAGVAAPRVLQAVSLGGRERLVVVRHANVDYLLGVSEGGISVLDRSPAAAAESATAAAMPCFLKDVKSAIPAFGWIGFRKLKSLLLSRHRCLSAAVFLNQAQTYSVLMKKAVSATLSRSVFGNP